MKRDCNICGSPLGDSVLKLGAHPCADRFLSKSDLENDSDKVYDLSICICDECLHVQTETFVNPIERYCEIDYSFIASSSDFAKKHWDGFYKSVIDYIGEVPDKVLEIGSNDGYLLKKFKDGGSDILGVDASHNMVELAWNVHGVNSFQGFFSRDLMNGAAMDRGSWKLVVANNVVNHIDDFDEFFSTLNRELHPDGLFVFEVPLWTANVENGVFDTIYHEHVNYFTFSSIDYLLNKYGFIIVNAEYVEYHGQSVRIYAKVTERENEWPELYKELAKEMKIGGLFDDEVYNKFQLGILKVIKNVKQTLEQYKRHGYTIVGIGAAAKGNTFLNTLGLTNEDVVMISDASPTKIGKYTAHSRIPIKTDKDLSKYDKVLAIVLTDNLPEKIRTIIRELNPDTEIEFFDTPNAYDY